MIISCSKKTTYHGKVLNKEDLSNLSLMNKQDLLNKFGFPTYIDPIEKKYFYYSEVREKITVINRMDFFMSKF